MSKNESKLKEVEPKIISFYTIVPKGGAFEVIKIEIDVANNKIGDLSTIGVEDVLPVSNKSVERSIRKDLGL